MISYSFTNRQREILIAIRDKSPISRKEIIDNAIKGKSRKEDITFLCNSVNDEFLMNGIDEDYNATAYGHELEDLLDEINRPRISPPK